MFTSFVTRCSRSNRILPGHGKHCGDEEGGRVGQTEEDDNPPIIRALCPRRLHSEALKTWSGPIYAFGHPRRTRRG